MPQEPDRLLPLAQSNFHILAVLLRGPLHGYAIAAEVEDLSEGRIRIAAGNLYPSLRSMTDQGLVQRLENGVGDRRKVYRLTDFGSRVLAAETARMEGLIRLVQSWSSS